MCRSRGRAIKGERLVCSAPHGHWKIISTIAALDAAGILTGCSFEGATDTEMFANFLEKMLVPALKPGQVVVMDNLAPHKSPRVAALIAQAGAKVLYLPPYSPDFNPIEMAISKMKSVLRREAKRTVATLHDALTIAVDSITQQDAANFIRHCGYATSG